MAGALFGEVKCHFSGQVQHLVKFGMIAGVRKVVFFSTKCSWRALKVQNSTGLVLCSTELYWSSNYFVVQSSTGVALCSTE